MAWRHVEQGPRNKVQIRNRPCIAEGEMVGWHHRLSGHEFKQILGNGEGHGSLVGRSPQGFRESDTTERLNHFK